MSHKRTVLIFGGSFSPPTLAHEAILRLCLAMPQFDEIWMMPCGERDDKTMTASDADRLAMARIVQTQIFANEPRLVVSDFELKLPRPTQTYATARALASAYPDIEFWWALGTDAYFSMPDTWEHGAELQKSMHLLVFNADGQAHIDEPNVTLLKLPPGLEDVSSTEARKSLAAGGSAAVLISQPVLDYIRKHGLYAQ